MKLGWARFRLTLILLRQGHGKAEMQMAKGGVVGLFPGWDLPGSSRDSALDPHMPLGGSWPLSIQKVQDMHYIL